MKNITSFLVLFTLIFLASTGIILLMSDISVKNPNLNNKSIVMMQNLETYQVFEEEFRFSENPTNYSLTGYETVAPEDKDNAESKGILDVFLFMGDAFLILPLFIHTMLPWLPLYAFAWLEGTILAVLGFFFTIAVYNAWKARKT